MAGKNPTEGEPIQPEILPEDEDAPRPTGLRRVERGAMQTPGLVSVLESLFRSPRREARQAREWADAARAHADLDLALTELGRSRRQLRSLPTILETDEERRDLELLRAKNERAEEERIARHKALSDELAEEEIRAKIAEARRRRQQSENPPPPPDEDVRRRREIARQFRERLGRRFTEQEIRAYAAQRIAEIKQRAGGAITPAVQREIDNVTDVMNSLLDEL